jgi:hypothetical protein
MAFDPITWALGYGLTKAATWALDKRKELSAKVRHAVKEWATSLPPELLVDPAAIFSETSTKDDEELTSSPALKALRHTLSESLVPSTEQWSNAIAERRKQVGGAKSGEVQPFFSAVDEVAGPHIAKLAARLHQICQQDQKLFRSSTDENIRSLKDQVEELNRQFTAASAAREQLKELQQPLMTATIGEKNRGAAATLGVRDFVYVEWQAYRSQELDTIREKFRCGAVTEAYAALRAFYASEAWENLPAGVQALALRVFASMELDRAGDIEAAKRWVALARQADPRANFQVINALITFWESGAEAAIQALGHPENIDAWNLLLVLRLATGDAKRVLAELDVKPFEWDAESFRIRALALLLLNRLPEAEASARESATRQPAWAAIRQTVAIIKYATTVCAEFHAWAHLAWPVPPPWSFVRTDDDALRNLRAAAAAFEELLSQTPIGAPDRPSLEIWRLATLSNDPEAQDEAKRFAQQLLELNPAHYRAAIWAVERGFLFDRGPVRAALNEYALKSGAEIDAITVAVSFTELDLDHDAARDLLEKSRERFREVGVESIWRLLFSQVLTLLKDKAAAKALLAEEPDVGFRLKCQAAIEKLTARETKDFGRVAEALIAAYEADQSSEALFQAAEACMYSDRPAWVLQRANELFAAFRTAAVLRMILQAAWVSGQADLCLDWLHQHADVFPSQTPPTDLRRLEIACLRRLGRLAEAVERATKLVEESPNPQNLLELFQTQFVSGDLPGCVATARLILPSMGVSPLHLLQMARAVGSIDKALATELWTAAMKSLPLEDDAVLLGVDVAYRLGLGQRSEALMRQLHRIATSGHSAIRAAPFDEVVSLMHRRREAQQKANRDYNGGVGPVHMISAMAGWPIGAIYHTQLSENAKAESPLRQAPAMARHGRRVLEANTELTRGTVVADVTAIMLAEQLGILDVVEEHLSPIFISAWLPRSLEFQRSQAEAHDAASDEARSSVLQLIETDKIAVVPTPWPLPERTDPIGKQMGALWCAGLERAKIEDGVLVDFYPLLSNDGNRQIVILPEEERDRVVSVGQVLAGLRGAGVLDDAHVRTAVSTIGSDAETGQQSAGLSRGRFVFLEQGIAEQLARAAILGPLCDHCRVVLGSSAHLFLKADAAATRTRSDLVKWLRGLLERVRRGISEKRYITFTRPLESDKAFGGLEENIDLQCLNDLIPGSSEQVRVVWCDDRFVNGHLKTEAGPVISTFELLGALRDSGGLDREVYFAKLLELRRMGVRYLPISAHEILYHLDRARINDQRLEETRELATLRMSIAAAVRDTERMQMPPPNQFSPGNLGELQWLMDLREAVSAAIQETWSKTDTKIAVVRSEWLFDCLHFDMGALWDLFRPCATVESTSQPFFADVFRLFLGGISLSHSADPHVRNSKRRLFYRWLYLRVITPVLRANPDAAAAIGNDLSNLFDSYAARSGIEERQIAVWMLVLYQDLPQAMQEIIGLPKIIRDHFDTRGGEIAVSVAGYSFPFANFWRAASAAVNGREAVVETFDGVKCTVVPGAPEEFGRGASLRPAGTSSDLPITSEFLPLLANDLQLRRRFLENHPNFFDLPRSQRAASIAHIVAVDDPPDRVEVMRSQCEASMPYFYRNLYQGLRSGSPLKLDDLMPPDVNNIARFLRLDTSQPANWDDASMQLIRDEGIKEALLRASSLPVRLPLPIVAGALQLGESEFGHLIESIGGRMLTPMSLLHLLHVISARAALERHWFSRATSIRDELLSIAGHDEVYAQFSLVLQCVFEQLRQRAVTVNWHSSVVLASAWEHAHEVYRTALAAGLSRGDLSSQLHEIVATSAALLDVRRIELLDDVVHPSRINWATYLLRGFGDVMLSLPIEIGRTLRPTAQEFAMALGDVDRREIIAAIAQETETRVNALGSFLGGGWREPLDAALPPDFLGTRFDPAPSLLAVEQLTAVETDLTDWTGWRSLWFLIQDAPFYTEHGSRIKMLLQSVPLVRLLESGIEKALPGLQFLCGQVRYYGDDAIGENFERSLLGCAEFCQTARVERTSFGRDNAAFEAVSWGIIEAAFLLSSRLSAKPELAPFHTLAAKLVSVCPGFGTLLRSRLGGRVPPLPFALARGAWPFYLTLRAAA